MVSVPLSDLIPDYIKRFEAYVPSKPDAELMKLYGCSRLFRLNNNENPLGPPPGAQEIIRRFPPMKASLYPSGDVYFVRNKLASRFSLDPDQFLFGNGANEVIAFVIKAFCQEGDNIITADRTFSVYEWVAEFSGFEARLVPIKDFAFDDEAMLKAIDGRTKIIFVCNPNNPTGTYWNTDKMVRFLDTVGGRQIVVIDEAYCEFVSKSDYPDGMKLMAEYPNVVVFRTFSKMYGLAGLRIGYLVGNPEVVDVIRRTCVVYSVNGVAQDAVMAAIDDDDHVARTRELVRTEKTYLASKLRALGLEVQAAEGCYVMVRLPMSDTLAYRKLMARGVMVRSMTGFRFPNWIRVSIGRHDAMKAFIEALSAILKNTARAPSGRVPS
ncbi:MAG: Histidinol-phosphate aminotransferase 2 [Syntrophorhabdus sp. PtaU1.Bin153]|nr:MAG: Histidinol-phosphate aminotransferase 2 [Syntrophorhabdus sp. PtaU1.Bin153]